MPLRPDRVQCTISCHHDDDDDDDEVQHLLAYNYAPVNDQTYLKICLQPQVQHIGTSIVLPAAAGLAATLVTTCVL